jgi:hypothetical protein
MLLYKQIMNRNSLLVNRRPRPPWAVSSSRLRWARHLVGCVLVIFPMLFVMLQRIGQIARGVIFFISVIVYNVPKRRGFCIVVLCDFAEETIAIKILGHSFINKAVRVGLHNIFDVIFCLCFLRGRYLAVFGTSVRAPPLVCFFEAAFIGKFGASLFALDFGRLLWLACSLLLSIL